MEVGTFILAPTWGDPAHYDLYVEEGFLTGESDAARFIETFDAELAAGNLEYEGKRRSNRLGMPGVRWVSRGAFERYRDRKIRLNVGRLEQYKHLFLVADFDLGESMGVVGEWRSGAVSAPGTSDEVISEGRL